MPKPTITLVPQYARESVNVGKTTGQLTDWQESNASIWWNILGNNFATYLKTVFPNGVTQLDSLSYVFNCSYSNIPETSTLTLRASLMSEPDGYAIDIISTVTANGRQSQITLTFENVYYSGNAVSVDMYTGGVSHRYYPDAMYWIQAVSCTATLPYPILEASAASYDVAAGQNSVISFTGRCGEALTVSYYSGSTLLYSHSCSSDTDTVQCPLSWFDTAGASTDSLQIRAYAEDANNRSADVFFTLTRPALQVNAAGPVTSGENATLSFSNRNGKALTVVLRNGSTTLATPASVSADSLSVTTADSWFQTAGVTSQSYMDVTVDVTDADGRTASTIFTLNAGNGLKPSVSGIAFADVQPTAAMTSSFSGMYIEGFTKIKVSATLTAVYGATVTSASFAIEGAAMTAMSYNNTTGKWEGTSVNPVTANGTVTITATDSRGMSVTATASFSSLTAYDIPSVTASYHRCRANGTADDSGGYCSLVLSYVITPLNNLNGKSAAVTSSIYNDSRELTNYTQTVSHFFAADIEHSYEIVVSVTDTVMTVSKTIVLSTAGVIMDFLSGGNGIGLGKVAETADMVEVSPDWTLKAAHITLGNDDLGTVLAGILQRLDNGGL